MEVPQKFKTELPHVPAIPLLGIYLKEMKILTGRDICTPADCCFTAALLTTVNTWKQSKYSSMDNAMQYTYRMNIIQPHTKRESPSI